MVISFQVSVANKLKVSQATVTIIIKNNGIEPVLYPVKVTLKKIKN